MKILLRKIGGRLGALLQGSGVRFSVGSGAIGTNSLLAAFPALTLALMTVVLVGAMFLASHYGFHPHAFAAPLGMSMGATAVAAPRKDTRLPFRMGTRRRFQPLGSFVFTPGTPLATIILPQVGFLSGIHLKLEGTITQTAGAATLHPLGYASLISRIRVNANLGSASIVDATAAGIELANYWYAPTAGPVRNTYANGAGANAVSYGLFVPINANDRTLLEVGLINLQAEQVRVTLDVTPAPALTSFLLAGGPPTASALTLFVGYEYWDVPNPARYLLPQASIVRILEEQQPIQAVGEMSYVVPRLGTLTQMSEYYILGATAAAQVLASLIAPTPQVNNWRIRANKTDEWMSMAARFAEIQECQFFNNTLSSFMRPGVRTWDFFHSDMQTRNFGVRDLIDTEKITTLEFVATIDAAVTPSAFTTRNLVRRVFQRLV
jgi:hypothetical protein